jgi:phospho-N-acetylmuramoyl-pentapeptide-transferase
MGWTRVMLALVVAFAIAVVIGPVLIKFLHRLRFGQTILDDGPSWHKAKQNTPTMGGFIFIIPIFFVALFFGIPALRQGDSRGLIVLLASICFGAIGFFDDYIKVRLKRNKGLTARQKLILQLLVAVVFLLSLRVTYPGASGLGSTLFVLPLSNYTVDVGVWYYPIVIVLIVGFVNAVNLTDGLDGLATGVTIPVAVFFAAVSAVLLSRSVTILMASAVGALMGFLLYNYHPAKVFMGDTGSLFLGGLVTTTAVALDMPLMILLVGFIYLIEAVSVMLQVAYFKLTKGKRLFKMAPFHHHLELCGLRETRIFAVYVGITVILCIVGFIRFAAQFG